MRTVQLFHDRPELVPSSAELLTAARNDATALVARRAHELARAVAVLDHAAPSGEFKELALEATTAAGKFSPYFPSIRLLNVSSIIHRIALLSGLHPLLEPELRGVSFAQDQLDEACYVQRQYNKFSCPSAVFASAVRTGHWQNLAALARSIPLDSVLRIDTTITNRFAQVVGCQPQLILALGRLSVFDAVTAALYVNAPVSQAPSIDVSVRF